MKYKIAFVTLLLAMSLPGMAQADPTLSKLKANRAVERIANQRAAVRSNLTYVVEADTEQPRACSRINSLMVACDYELNYYDRASVEAGDRWERDEAACVEIDFASPECDALLNGEDPVTDVLVRTCYADDVTVTLSEGRVTLAEPYTLVCDDDPDQFA